MEFEDRKARKEIVCYYAVDNETDENVTALGCEDLETAMFESEESAYQALMEEFNLTREEAEEQYDLVEFTIYLY